MPEVLGAEFLREVTLKEIVEKIPEIRKKTGDRAILRAYHFQNDNQRVVDQVEALEKGDFNASPEDGGRFGLQLLYVQPEYF